MASKRNRKEEYLESKSNKKLTYYFVDDARSIKVKSKEVYPETKQIIHYPFDRNGKPKYSKITKIVYQNLPDPLPRGIIKDPNWGYGFTRVLSPILYALTNKFNKVQSVIVRKKGKCEIKQNVAYLPYTDLNSFYPKMDSLLKSQGQQKEALTYSFINKYFSQTFKQKKPAYIKGSLYSLISELDNNTAISKEDYEAALSLVTAHLGKENIQSREIVIATKEKIERKFLENAILDFKKILSRKLASGNLEKRWETFFKESSWIVSHLFSLPVFLYANQAYVGGKEIFNGQGKLTDFLFKNSLTDNVTIVELKTHKTLLLARKPYRGKDVYALSEDLSGAVNQALDQKQNLLNDFYHLRSKVDKDDWFESLSPKCMIIAGSIKDLPPNGRRSFEMFRNNLHGIEILTFDEVLGKIEFFVSLITKQKKKRKEKNSKP